MPSRADQKEFVLVMLQNMIDFFSEHPEHAEQAAQMYAKAGNSEPIFAMIISKRCEQKADSKLQRFNTDDGPGQLRDLVKSFADDDEVAPLFAKFKKAQSGR